MYQSKIIKIIKKQSKKHSKILFLPVHTMQFILFIDVLLYATSHDSVRIESEDNAPAVQLLLLLLLVVVRLPSTCVNAVVDDSVQHSL